MHQLYYRCDCKPSDPDVLDNLDLFDQSGQKCTHQVKGSALMEKLKKKRSEFGGTLYAQVKGKSRSDLPIYKMLEKVKMQPDGVRLMTVKKENQPVIPGIVERPPRTAPPFVQAGGSSQLPS